LVVAVSLFPKSKPTNPVACTPLNKREEGRVREKQRGRSHGRRRSIDLSPKLVAATVAIHTPFQEENQIKPACMQTPLSVE
jgi:hypothetical protein